MDEEGLAGDDETMTPDRERALRESAQLREKDCPHWDGQGVISRGECAECVADALLAAEQRGERRVRDALNLQLSNDVSGCETVEIFMGYQEHLGRDEWHSFAKNELTPAQWWALTGQGEPQEGE